MQKHWLVWWCTGKTWNQWLSPRDNDSIGQQEDPMLQHTWCPKSCKDQGTGNYLSLLLMTTSMNLCSRIPKCFRYNWYAKGMHNGIMRSNRPMSATKTALLKTKPRGKSSWTRAGSWNTRWSSTLSCKCNPECGVWCCSGGSSCISQSWEELDTVPAMQKS